MRAAGARKMGEECTGKICNTHSSRHLCCTQDAFQAYASGTVLRSRSKVFVSEENVSRVLPKQVQSVFCDLADLINAPAWWAMRESW